MGPMSCAELVEQVSDYLDDALGTEQQQRVNVHLADCRNCESHVNEFRVTLRMLSGLPSDSLPAEVVRNLLARYQQQAP